jgi:hypothetical protein
MSVFIVDEYTWKSTNWSYFLSKSNRLEKVNLPFSQFCDVDKEFPCLCSNVSDPLNLTQNRPCIPYTKIGDEIKDCHNAYDEKNTLESSGGDV